MKSIVSGTIEEAEKLMGAGDIKSQPLQMLIKEI